MQDAAFKAQGTIENLNASRKDWKNTAKEAYGELGDAEDKIKKLNAELAETKRKLATARARLHNKTEDLKSAEFQQYADDSLITSLTRDKDRLEKELSEAKAKKPEEPKQSKPTESNNTSDVKVTDSKILSASTGLVNAVTQTVVALLPQYSSRTTDDIDGKVSTKISKSGYIILNREDNPDMRVLIDAKSHGYKSCKYIKDSIKIILRSSNSVISDFWKKIDDVEHDIHEKIAIIEPTFWNKLESKYNFDSIDGIKSFANDYSSGSGEVGSMIKDAVNEAKKLSSIESKYKSMNRTIYTKDKADAAVKDYYDAYQSYQIAIMTYRIIEDMATDLKKRLHNIKEPGDD